MKGLNISKGQNIHTVSDAQELVDSLSEEEARQKINELTALKKKYNLKGGRRQHRRKTASLRRRSKHRRKSNRSRSRSSNRK